MKRLKGFTLVELVITIAIVIILALVSMPIYNGYTKKAKMAEAYALLGTIFSAQKAYYSEYGYFLFDRDSSSGIDKYTCNEIVLGIDARGNKYFTNFNVGWVETGKESKYSLTARILVPSDLRAIETRSILQLSYDMRSGNSGTFTDL